MQTLLEPVRLLTSSSNAYTIRLARDTAEVRAAQALRFATFNLELNEGLVESLATGLDADPFDEVCEHLLVEDVPSGEIVGTYRLQTGLSAAAHLGYYSEQEFDFRPFTSPSAHSVLAGEVDFAVARFAALIAAHAGIPDRTARARWLQHICQRALRVFHVELRVTGLVPSSGLLVCNHLKWLLCPVPTPANSRLLQPA